jgi:hypothetical protein
VGVLNNHGRIRWSDTGNLAMGSQSVTATLDNAPGAVFEAENDATIAWTVYSPPVVTNAGTFRKIAGTNATTLSGVPFVNTGMVEARTGTLAFLGGYSQTGGALRLGLWSLSQFGRIQINGNAALTGTLGADLYDGFRPRAGDAFGVISFASHSGAFTGFDLPAVAAWDTNATLYGATQVRLTVLNSRPTLQAPADATITEENPWSATWLGADPDTPADTLTYSLVSGPTNATLEPATGLCTWTPSEAQGPGTYLLVVSVTDSGLPSLSTTQQLTLVVLESNQPPTLVQPTNLTADEMAAWTAFVSATDPDLPANLLTYSLVSAPEGVQLNPSTGLLLWTPTEDQGPGTVVMTVAVTDVHLLSVTNQFTVTVREVNRPPRLAATPDLTLVQGLSLNTRLSATDPDLPANALAFDLLASPPDAHIDPSTGDLTWTPAAGPVPSTHSFTVQVTDAGTPPAAVQRSFRVTVLPPPRLLITQNATEVWLSWPAAYASGQLQSATELIPPIDWQAVTNVPGRVGDWLVVARPIDATRRYYRIEHR